MKNRKETSFVRNEDIAQDSKWRKWFVIDASDKALGRLSTKVATLLCGKHKPQYTAHVDCGDFVIVINADKINLSGNKLLNKTYYRHTGYPGGLKEIKAEALLKKNPCALVYKSVKGMMPKNALNRQSLNKLKIYTEPTHPHLSQNPKSIEI